MPVRYRWAVIEETVREVTGFVNEIQDVIQIHLNLEVTRMQSNPT